MPQDRDFVIELDGQPGSYRLHVSSPAGDGSVDVGLDPARLGVDLDTLQARVLASATTSRSIVPELERPLRQVGQALFEAVFQASAGALFLSSRNEVERGGGRLRIVLRLHPPELAVLPWELLFSEHYGGYLCRRSPMVRYVDAPEPVRPLTVTPPLRVLGMTALPGDLAALDADTEQRRLQQLLAPLQARGLIAVDWVAGQSWEAAQDALYAGCQVFHFIGHGGFDPVRGEGVIAFADERGRRQMVGASALADLLSVADPMPRLVILNSCETAVGADTDVFSSVAATLVRTVPAVVAMQFAVTDDAAAVFSRTFYQALVHNRGVDEAVRAGRIALTGWNPDTLEWVTPVLYLRSRDTRLFDLAGPGSVPGTDDQPRREAVLATYWAARLTGEWEPAVAQLAALYRQLPSDREVEQAYYDARLAARYAQGRRAEQEQDWAEAVAHYQAVSSAQPEYRDVAARLGESSRRRDIAALQEQLRMMFTAKEFQAVAGIADRLAELDPSAADPDGLTTQARQRLQQRQAREDADRQAREDADRQAREDADRQAREDADRQAREDADRQAREDADRQAREDADRQAREDADRQAREDADRQAREDADRQAREHLGSLGYMTLAAIAKRLGLVVPGTRRELTNLLLAQSAELRTSAEQEIREQADRPAAQEAERRAAEVAKRPAKERASQPTGDGSAPTDLVAENAARLWQLAVEKTGTRENISWELMLELVRQLRADEAPVNLQVTGAHVPGHLLAGGTEPYQDANTGLLVVTDHRVVFAASPILRSEPSWTLAIPYEMIREVSVSFSYVTGRIHTTRRSYQQSIWPVTLVLNQGDQIKFCIAFEERAREIWADVHTRI